MYDCVCGAFFSFSQSKFFVGFCFIFFQRGILYCSALILSCWCFFFSFYSLHLDTNAFVCVRFYSLEKTLHQIGIFLWCCHTHTYHTNTISLQIRQHFLFLYFYCPLMLLSRFEYFLFCSWLCFSHTLPLYCFSRTYVSRMLDMQIEHLNKFAHQQSRCSC